jgi:DNA-binding NtrC family response regulator
MLKKTATRVLLVEDDVAVRGALRDAMITSGFEVDEADNGVQALRIISASLPDVVLSDVRMPDMDGLELLRELRERNIDVDVVMMTAFDDMPTVVTAMKSGASEFLVKPLELDEVLGVLQRVAADRAFRRKPSASRVAQEGTLIGRHPKMIEVFKLLGQAAQRASMTVLIRGESGTGKELVARAIHAHAENSSHPFVPVNCAALPATLLESELFGHVKGAFTGAVGSRRGRFAQAGAGTIFLDEIGDTSIDFQTKLLRVLQDREYQPVGSDDAERSEARVIAATHQDLEQLIVEKRFREDLYYRLKVFEIHLPPLRERGSDILSVATHFLGEWSQKFGVDEILLSPDASERLMQHDWSGNVRELQNCLARAAVIAVGGVIRSEHLPLQSTVREKSGTTQTLSEIERAHVEHVLQITGGHKGRTAKMLGIPRARLSRLLDKYGLQ